jgi:SAM-dependent methyltransferase
MLVRDENWNKKQDEIAGEVEFNTVTVSAQTHLERNSFINGNSLEFLRQTMTDLRGKHVLVVGSSMAEAECFSGLSGSMVGLDIVPDLTVMYRDACQKAALRVEWVCGDGECLPFPAESFDVVIVRQALHHMIRYYSAISEFFRVARIGGKILIIEEPYSAPDLDHPAIAGLTDTFPLYHNVKLRDLRRSLGWRGAAGVRSEIDFSTAEAVKNYIPATVGDPESLLADKYHRFSAAELIVALRLQTNVFDLIWPDRIGWARRQDSEVLFCTGPNPASTMGVVERLSIPTTFSAVAIKTSTTDLLRSRADLVPVGVMVG